MRCPTCASDRYRAEAGCPECGGPKGADRVEPMLALAHLLRMRGRWSDAADACVDVLRLDPQNATAHSLLGDIAQDRGRPEEARHWYQLALELNPASEADRAKLARAEETLEARQQRAEWAAVLEGRSQPLPTSLLVRESLQRVAALVGAAVCGIILVMATVVSATDRVPTAADEPPLPLRRSPAPRAPLLAKDTPRERELHRQTAAGAAGGAAQVVRLELDPRSRSASLRLFLPRRARGTQSTAEFRVTVMREAYRACRALLEADPTLALIHVTVVGPMLLPGGMEDTAGLLIATLRPESLVIDAERVTPVDLERSFRAAAPPAWATELEPLPGGGMP